MDAEEADRLELTLDVIAAVLPDPSLRGWDGFGLAVQAYLKRAPAVIDWLDETARGARPPPHGAIGQGRVLGHRGQARAGARARRLSGVYPQGDDRPLLRRLHAQTARGPRAALSAIRHPQRAHRGERDRVCRRRGRVRVPAPARHGRGALRSPARRLSRGGVPGLRAGRRPPRSAGLSGPPAAGEWRQLLVRVGCRRSFGADRRPSSGVRRTGSGTRAMRATRRFRCRATSMRRSGATPPASNSATAQASTRCSPKSATARAGRGRAARQRQRARRCRARDPFADRRQGDRPRQRRR